MFWCTLWWTNIAGWHIPIFNRKTHLQSGSIFQPAMLVYGSVGMVSYSTTVELVRHPPSASPPPPLPAVPRIVFRDEMAWDIMVGGSGKGKRNNNNNNNNNNKQQHGNQQQQPKNIETSSFEIFFRTITDFYPSPVLPEWTWLVQEAQPLPWRLAWAQRPPAALASAPQRHVAWAWMVGAALEFESDEPWSSSSMAMHSIDGIAIWDF